MRKGEIIFCVNFEFADRDKGKKYFIILNNPSQNQPFLGVLTTTNKKDRYENPGCYAGDGYFFIEKDTEWFPKSTWIKFNQVYEFPYQEALNKEALGIFKTKSIISVERMNAIINCIKMSFDITKEQIALLG